MSTNADTNMDGKEKHQMEDNNDSVSSSKRSRSHETTSQGNTKRTTILRTDLAETKANPNSAAPEIDPETEASAIAATATTAAAAAGNAAPIASTVVPQGHVDNEPVVINEADADATAAAEAAADTATQAAAAATAAKATKAATAAMDATAEAQSVIAATTAAAAEAATATLRSIKPSMTILIITCFFVIIT